MYESINGDYLLRPEGDTSSSKLGADLLQSGGNLGESIDSNQLQIQGSMVYCNAYKEIGGVTSGKEQDVLDDDPCISTAQTQKTSFKAECTTTQLGSGWSSIHTTVQLFRSQQSFQ